MQRLKKIFVILIFLIYFYYTNYVISPTVAIVNPLTIEENIFLDNNKYNFKNKTNQKYIVVLTGYSSSPDETDDDPWITASGEWVSDGTVASNFLSLGTKIKIPEIFGDKIFVVKDRMNKRYDNKNHIDVWFPTKEEALVLGKKITQIIVISD
ncbi:MAG: hypothetical protein KatS3mg094_310 [Candidatus Parcubacteria bacterium]|nr:MAG: hypothetical protein KatS3mg094_310 [Candidatus Parcubacteria bacterium]